MDNAAFFKSRRMVSTQYGYIDMPIRSQDKKVLKASWPVIKRIGLKYAQPQLRGIVLN